MTDKSVVLETLAEPLRAYLAGTGPTPSSGAMVTFQTAYIRECKLDRNADYSDYSQLLDDVVAKRSARVST